MYKVFTIAFFLFFFELFFLQYFNNHLLALMNQSRFNTVAFQESQRRVFHIIRTIQDNNSLNNKAVYVFGGSGTREFFDLEKKLNEKIDTEPYKQIHICASSSQGLIDTLRLVENINVEGSLVVLGISPKKFWSEDPSYLEMSSLVYGKYLKYPVASQAVSDLYDDMPFGFNTRLQLLPPAVNTFIYLVKDFSIEQLKHIKRSGAFDIRFFDKTISDQHVKTYTKRLDINELAQLEKQFQSTYMTKTKENLQLNIKILEKIIAVGRQKQLTLVLFDIPLNPLVSRLYQEEYQEYLEALEGVKNIKHIRFQEKTAAHLFHDTSHLNPAGKKFFYEYMVSGLYKAME